MPTNVVIEVLRYIKENPGSTPRDLSVALNIDQNRVKKIVYRMKNKGFIDKAGGGYILTGKGEWFLNKVYGSGGEDKPIVSKTNVSVSTGDKGFEEFSKQSYINLLDRLNEIENKVKKMEAYIENIKRELESVRRSIEEAVEAEHAGLTHRSLPIPVMSIQDAKQLLGPSFDTHRGEGRIVIVGSLAVDRTFYEDFKKKFPIPIGDKDKLSELEQVLLEEMIRDARVIISGGRQYKLIE